MLILPQYVGVDDLPETKDFVDRILGKKREGEWLMARLLPCKTPDKAVIAHPLNKVDWYVKISLPKVQTPLIFSFRFNLANIYNNYFVLYSDGRERMLKDLNEMIDASFQDWQVIICEDVGPDLDLHIQLNPRLSMDKPEAVKQMREMQLKLNKWAEDNLEF